MFNKIKEKLNNIPNLRRKSQVLAAFIQLGLGLIYFLVGLLISFGTQQGIVEGKLAQVPTPLATNGFLLMLIALPSIGFALAMLFKGYDKFAKAYNDKFVLMGINIAVALFSVILFLVRLIAVAGIAEDTGSALVITLLTLLALILVAVVLIGLNLLGFFSRNETSKNEIVFGYTPDTVEEKSVSSEQAALTIDKFIELKKKGVVSEAQYNGVVDRMSTYYQK